MILLDTNILTELMRPEPEPRVLNWLDRQPEQRLFLPAIAKAEIETGISMLPNGKRKQVLTQSAQAVLGAFAERCLALDCHATPQYASILALSTTLGRPISVEDAQIATIAISNDLALATRNYKDFDFIDGLALINPWRE